MFLNVTRCYRPACATNIHLLLNKKVAQKIKTCCNAALFLFLPYLLWHTTSSIAFHHTWHDIPLVCNTFYKKSNQTLWSITIPPSLLMVKCVFIRWKNYTACLHTRSNPSYVANDHYFQKTYYIYTKKFFNLCTHVTRPIISYNSDSYCSSHQTNSFRLLSSSGLHGKKPVIFRMTM